MVNTHIKGQRKETMCAHELENQNWKIIFKSMTVKLGPIFRGLDVADLFDVIAIKENSKRWLFVSVKHGSSFRKEHEELIKRFKFLNGLEGMEFQVWVWNPPMWRGRGKDKHFEQAHWKKIDIV